MIPRPLRALGAIILFCALASAAPPINPAPRDLPEPHTAPPNAGHDLLGTRPPEWDLTDWLHSEPLTLSSLHGKVILIRWWTAPDCPFCAASADGLNQLWTQYHDQGLIVIGAYHHKSRAPLMPDFVPTQAARLGFEFPVAIDPEWRTLRKWWLSTGDRGWTSVTFLIGRDGAIEYIHGGGAYWPGEPGFAALEQAVKKALASALTEPAEPAEPARAKTD